MSLFKENSSLETINLQKQLDNQASQLIDIINIQNTIVAPGGTESSLINIDGGDF